MPEFDYKNLVETLVGQAKNILLSFKHTKITAMKLFVRHYGTVCLRRINYLKQKVGRMRHFTHLF